MVSRPRRRCRRLLRTQRLAVAAAAGARAERAAVSRRRRRRRLRFQCHCSVARAAAAATARTTTRGGSQTCLSVSVIRSRSRWRGRSRRSGRLRRNGCKLWSNNSRCSSGQCCNTRSSCTPPSPPSQPPRSPPLPPPLCQRSSVSQRCQLSPTRRSCLRASRWRLLHRHRRHSRRRSRRRRRRPSSTISSNSGARRLRALHRREHSRGVPAAFTGSSNTHSNHHSNRRRKWRHASISRRSTHRSIRDRTARRRCPLRPRPIHTHGRAVRRWPTCSNLRPSRPRRRAAVVPLLALCRVAIVKRCCAHRTSTHRRVQFAPRPSCHPPFLLRSPARGRCAGQRQPRLWSGSFYPGCRRPFLPSSPPRVDGRRCCPTARAPRRTCPQMPPSTSRPLSILRSATHSVPIPNSSTLPRRPFDARWKKCRALLRASGHIRARTREGQTPPRRRSQTGRAAFGGTSARCSPSSKAPPPPPPPPTPRPWGRLPTCTARPAAGLPPPAAVQFPIPTSRGRGHRQP